MDLKILKQRIDYSKLVTGKELDYDTYNRKFAMWDYVLKHDLLSKNDSNALILLRDLTIYCYAFLRDDSGQPFKMTAYQDAIAGCTHKPKDAMSDNRFVLYVAANQTGKAIPDEEMIPTPSGFKRNGDLCTGDYVYGSDGKPTKILNTIKNKDWQLYRITFNDGTSIDCSLEHLWICKSSKERFRKIYTSNGKTWANPVYDKWQVYTTKQIIEMGGYSPETTPYKRFSIPVTKGVNYPEKKLLINPYVLGLLLGDGSLTRGVNFINGEDYIINYLKSNYSFHTYSKKGTYALTGTIKGLVGYIRELGLFGCKSINKFIPKDYLLASYEQRLELFKGMMDTDGSVSVKHSDLEYSTSSEQLKDDFLELLHSLGGLLSKLTSRIGHYKDESGTIIDCNVNYRIRFKVMFNPFNLPRKKELYQSCSVHKHEKIIYKIEHVNKGNASCINVDNADNSYLAGKDYIVTHNSRHLVSNAIYLTQTMDNINVIMISKSLPQSQFLLATIRQVLNNSVFGGSWREDIGETANTTQLTFSRNDGKIINRIICAPAGEGTLGYPVHYMFLDEADFYDDAKKFFWKVALPRTNFTKGQIVIFSNPNPEIARTDSLLWDLWTGSLFKRKFKFNFLDAPWNTRDEYDMVRKSSPSYIFASTHDGDFPVDGGGFFTQLEINDMLQQDWHNRLPIVDRPVYIGLDVAKVRDRTVLTLGTLHENKDDKKISDLHVRYMHHFPLKMDYNLVVDKVKEIVDYYQDNHHGVARVGFDATGVGNAIGDMLRNKGIFAQPIIFSIQSKSKMFANFKLLAEQRRIKIVHDDDCKTQLSNLIFAKTTSGQLSIKHSKEDVHDDFPDSLCCLIDVSIVPSRVGVTATFVGNGKVIDSNPLDDDDSNNPDSIRDKMNNKFMDDDVDNDVHGNQVREHRNKNSKVYNNFFDNAYN